MESHVFECRISRSVKIVRVSVEAVVKKKVPRISTQLRCSLSLFCVFFLCGLLLFMCIIYEKTKSLLNSRISFPNECSSRGIPTFVKVSCFQYTGVESRRINRSRFTTEIKNISSDYPSVT